MRTSARAAALVAAVAAVVLITACEPIPTKPGTARVVMLGDSVPSWLIRDGSSGVDTDEVTLINGTLAACDGAKDNPPARSRTGEIVPTPDGCAPGWPKMYPPHLTIRADVAVVMAGTHAMLDHKLSGVWRHPCHAPARSWYQADIEARVKYLKGKADKVVVVLPAWPGGKSGWIMPADSAKRADCVRSVMKAGATAGGATIVDFGAFLCPTGVESCRGWRTKDGMHIDANRAATVMTWLMGEVTPDTADAALVPIDRRDLTDDATVVPPAPQPTGR